MPNKTFLAINFGCRVNAAELNQLSQKYMDLGYTPCPVKGRVGEGFSPDLIIINTCSVTKKGDIESLSRIRKLSQKYPKAEIIATGCARLDKVKDLPHLTIIQNNDKDNLSATYTPQILDKFSYTNRYLLKIQTGCTQMCSYCIVPYRRPKLWSLPIQNALNTVNNAINNGYQEIIITGINIEQYEEGFSQLLESLLKETTIPLISFGSIPINCIDNKFIELLIKYPRRISSFLHIPIQSGSDKILTSMRRPYNKQKIINTFNKLKSIKPPTLQGEVAEGRRGFEFGTDIIIGFPGESDADFQETLDLCQSINFSKIHAFKFSPRPNTFAHLLWQQNKVDPKTVRQRQKILANAQTTPPSHQKPGI